VERSLEDVLQRSSVSRPPGGPAEGLRAYEMGGVHSRASSCLCASVSGAVYFQQGTSDTFIAFTHF
jgi:hypothetical protein